MIALDSSAVIEVARGTEKGQRIGKILEEEISAISVITLNEVFVNARETEQNVLKEFLNTFEILPIDTTIAYKSVEVEKALKKKGKPIGKLDIFIASTCLIHNLKIITTDNDFSYIDGLKIMLL